MDDVSTLTRPRGPLPPRVYWTRRMSVLGIALLLVFGIGRVLGSSSDGSSAPDQARQAGAQTRAGPAPSGTAGDERGKKDTRKKNKKRTRPSAGPTAPVLVDPAGPCVDSDVVVTPDITEAEADDVIRISLQLSTRLAEACTWTVSPETLTLKITSGEDDIWSSRQCPTAVPTRDVVVRRVVATEIGVRWNGKRSDETCSALTEWALPGFYHVVAAALAGEPTDVQFELLEPPRTVVTTTITPSPSPGDGGKKKRKKPDPTQPTDAPTDAPTGTPTGATEPG